MPRGWPPDGPPFSSLEPNGGVNPSAVFGARASADEEPGLERGGMQFREGAAGSDFGRMDDSGGDHEASEEDMVTDEGEAPGHGEGIGADVAPRLRPKACDACFRLRKKCSLAAFPDTEVLPPGLRCEGCTAFDRQCCFTREVLTRGPKKGSVSAAAKRKAAKSSKKRRQKGSVRVKTEEGLAASEALEMDANSSSVDSLYNMLANNNTMDSEDEPAPSLFGSPVAMPAANTPHILVREPSPPPPSLVDSTLRSVSSSEHVPLDPPNLLGVRNTTSLSSPSRLRHEVVRDDTSIFGDDKASVAESVVYLGREVGPFENLEVRGEVRAWARSKMTLAFSILDTAQPLPPSDDLLRVVQDYFMVNNVNSGMKLIHYKTFFSSLSSGTVTRVFGPNELYPASNGAMPPPLPLFLAMAAIGIVMEPLQTPPRLPERSGLRALAEPRKIDISQGFGTPLSNPANSRSTSNNLARHAWTFIQPWLERLGLTETADNAPLIQTPRLDPAVYHILLALTALLWRSCLFLRLEATRNLLHVAVSLALRMGCSEPRSLTVPYPEENPTGTQLYAYYKAQLVAESIRRTFWALYIHDRTLSVLDPGPFAIPDDVAWEMNIPCFEADFDLVSETIAAIEMGMENVPYERQEELLNRVRWDVLPRQLLLREFRTLRVKRNPPGEPMQKRFTAIISVMFVIGKATDMHVKAKSMGIELFDPQIDATDERVRKLVVKLMRNRGRIQGFFDKLPDWYAELDHDPAGFVERQMRLPIVERLSVETFNAGCQDLLVIRLACLLCHGPIKPDPTDPAHRAWFAAGTPNHLGVIARMLPPLTQFPDLTGRPRAGLLPVFAVDRPELSLAGLCLHHTLKLVELFKALVTVDPLGLRNSVVAHHAVVQAAVYRAVLALGGVLEDPLKTGSKKRGRSDEGAFAAALADVEFIEQGLAGFKSTHDAKALSKEVVSAVKKQLLDGPVEPWLLQPNTPAPIRARSETPDRRSASRDPGMDASDDGRESEIGTITARAAESGFISDGLAALIAHMGSRWHGE